MYDCGSEADDYFMSCKKMQEGSFRLHRMYCLGVQQTIFLVLEDSFKKQSCFWHNIYTNDCFSATNNEFLSEEDVCRHFLAVDIADRAESQNFVEICLCVRGFMDNPRHEEGPVETLPILVRLSECKWTR